MKSFHLQQAHSLLKNAVRWTRPFFKSYCVGVTAVILLPVMCFCFFWFLRRHYSQCFFFFLLQKRKSKRRSKKGTFQWTDSWHQGGRRRCGPHFCGVICVCVGGRDQKKKTKRGMGWGGWGILGVGSGVTGGARLLGQQIKDEASGIFWPWSWCSGQSRPSKMDLT